MKTLIHHQQGSVVLILVFIYLLDMFPYKFQQTGESSPVTENELILRLNPVLTLDPVVCLQNLKGDDGEHTDCNPNTPEGTVFGSLARIR